MEYFAMETENDSLSSNTTNSTCKPIPAETEEFILALKIIVGATCVLSILGAGLIILTYVAFRDLRTTARQLLANLSVADIIVAASHLAGLLTNYERFFRDPCNTSVSSSNGDVWCSAQGGLTMFSSLASVLWTLAVAVYLLTVIVVRRPNLARKFVVVFYLVCWGIPTVLVVVFGVEHFLGFEENVDIGWCYLKRHDVHVHSNSTHRRDVIPPIVGYDIWLYVIFIILPILYIWIRCHVKIKLTRINGHPSMSLHSQAKSKDLKLIFVPLIFVLLRMWGAILGVPLYYMDEETRHKFRGTWFNAILVLLTGIGSSVQGLANAILFVVFTQVVREKLLKTLKCYSCRKKPRPYVIFDDEDDINDEETTQFPTESENTQSLLVNADMSGSEEPLLHYHDGKKRVDWDSMWKQ